MALLAKLYPPPLRRIKNDTTRRLVLGGTLVVLGLAVALVALIAVTLLRNDDPDLAAGAPPLPAGTSSSAASTSGNTPLHFTIAEGTQVKYVVREQLTVAPVPSNAVGIARGVTGDLYLAKDGLAKDQKSQFKVDLLSIKSDEALRDRAMRGSLGTDKTPTATYTIESLTGFPTGYGGAKQVSLTMTGTMNMHDQNKPITWTVMARQGGDYLTAIADTDFKMSDFGITPPNASITRVEDGVHLQITLVAKLQK